MKDEEKQKRGEERERECQRKKEAWDVETDRESERMKQRQGKTGEERVGTTERERERGCRAR